MLIRQEIARRYPALASRDFTIFWVGQFVSLIGTWMQSTTQPYLAYRLSGKPFDLGLIGFSSALPTLILALPGGVLVERLDKRKTVITMQVVMMVQAFIMAFLALTGVIQIWHIAALAFLLGTANAIEITARQAMLIELVGKESLPNAIALQSTIFNAARVIGPSLVAPFLIFIQGSGEGWAFLVNGVSYLFIIVSLNFVRTPFKTAPVIVARNWLVEFREGQAYIRQTRSVAMIILMAAVLGFVGFPLLQQIPVIARDVLAQGLDTEAARAARNSALYTAQGVGALVAALGLASFNPKNKGRLLTAGQVVFIAGLLAIAFTRNLPVALLIFVLIGWGSITALATMNTLIQLEVPDYLRGRVFSTYLWGLQGIAPFGSLVVGWMAQNWGVPSAALACGMICLVIIGGIHLTNPEIKNMVV
ncbi:MAG: MFS transporter [Chloroflexi bacterium]|nr:MFS transporter [Chloroflexota bacterium]